MTNKMQKIEVKPLLTAMLEQINNKIKDYDPDQVLMVGIHTGGYWVAEQLYQQLNLPNPLGSLDISFYRDDFTQLGLHPKVTPSELPTDIENKHIILVDDVLYTGRTVRAALNEIFDYGRPASVIFCSLVDRIQHELPICADIIGTSIELPKGKQIKLSGPEPLSLKIINTESTI